MKVEWTETAILHLKHVQEYISEDDPYAAERVGEALYSVANILVEFPGAGRVGCVPNTRELVAFALYYSVYSCCKSCVYTGRNAHIFEMA